MTTGAMIVAHRCVNQARGAQDPPVKRPVSGTGINLVAYFCQLHQTMTRSRAIWMGSSLRCN